MTGFIPNSKAKERVGFGALLSAVVLFSGVALADEPADLPLIVDGVPMLVKIDSSYVKFNPIAYIEAETGEKREVEPIPTPAMRVVVRNDGNATTAADRVRARQAMQYLCEQFGTDYLLKARFETNPAGHPVWVMGTMGSECRA